MTHQPSTLSTEKEAKIFIDVKADIWLPLTEGEARALNAICCYGPEEFKKWFYRNLGKAYLQPHEKHIDSLFVKAQALSQRIYEIDQARKKITVL